MAKNQQRKCSPWEERRAGGLGLTHTATTKPSLCFLEAQRLPVVHPKRPPSQPEFAMVLISLAYWMCLLSSWPQGGDLLPYPLDLKCGASDILGQSVTSTWKFSSSACD
jgi:hypothetical protein